MNKTIKVYLQSDEDADILYEILCRSRTLDISIKGEQIDITVVSCIENEVEVTIKPPMII